MLALAKEIGFERGERGRNGMVLAAAVGTFIIPANILPANLPNVLMAGAADKLYGISFTYTEFLLLHFPVAGLLKGVALICLIYRLFPAQIPNPGPKARTAVALGSPGRKLLLITSVALVLWMMDFAHGISPGWIALLAAIVCLLPWVGLSIPKAFAPR